MDNDWLDYPCVVASAELRYGQWHGLAIYVPSATSYDRIEARAVTDDETSACLQAVDTLTSLIKVTKKPLGDEPRGQDEDDRKD